MTSPLSAVSAEDRGSGDLDAFADPLASGMASRIAPLSSRAVLVLAVYHLGY